MTDIDTLASLLAETGMEEDVSDIDAVQAYRTALRSTYVSRDGDECGRTYNLVDEAAADAAIEALQERCEYIAADFDRMQAECKREKKRAEKVEDDLRWRTEQRDDLLNRLEKAEAALAGFLGPTGESPTEAKLRQAEAALAKCERQKHGLAAVAKKGMVAANRVIELEAEVEKLRNLLGYADTGGWFYSYDEERAKRIELESEVKRLKEQLDKPDEAYGEMLSGNGVLKDKLAEAEYAAKENRAAMDNAIKAWREAEAQLDRIDPSRLVDRGEV